MLAVLAVLLPLALSTLTFTHMHVVLAAERLSFYRSSLGWRRLEASFEVGEVLHVCATSPSGRFHKHLLLRTVLGLECIGCAEASRVVHAVHEGWKHTDGRATD
jgi:hypothetical protein